MRMARVSDVCIMLAPPSTEPQQRDILIDMLFGSGVPLLLVPANWNKPGPIRKAIVAWDGGSSAARAVRDALPLLADAEMVEVVSVLGEKDIAAEASGADIARHLARHCREVSVNVLPVGERRRRRHVVRARNIDAGRPDGHGRLWPFPFARVCLGRRDARHACEDRYSHAALALRRRAGTTDVIANFNTPSR